MDSPTLMQSVKIPQFSLPLFYLFWLFLGVLEIKRCRRKEGIMNVFSVSQEKNSLPHTGDQ